MATSKKRKTKKPTRSKKGATNTSKSDQIRALLKSGMPPVDIAKKVRCSLPLVYQVRGAGKSKKAGKTARTTRRSKATPPPGAAGVLAAVQRVESERERMREALERVQALIADALA